MLRDYSDFIKILEALRMVFLDVRRSGRIEIW
jgi:hypothetical protein